MRLTNILAGACESAGDLEKAARFARRAVEGRTAALGEDHPDVINSMRGLTRILTKMQRYEEAEAIGLKCLAQSRATFGEDSEEAQAAAELLAAVYDAWGRPAQAAALRPRAEP